MAETDTTATSRNVQYPNEEFQSIYDSILASMGDDDTLRANLEAALRPMYEQSLAQLQQQRLAGNAAIDVDAYSRGMGNSSWVTDAKLQNLRNAESNIASLNANYNNTLFTNLMNAIADRDDKAYNQAMQWWQYNESKKGDGGNWWDDDDDDGITKTTMPPLKTTTPSSKPQVPAEPGQRHQLLMPRKVRAEAKIGGSQ